MYRMFKRAQTKTHPWDGDIEDTRHRSAWFSLLFAALFFILIQSPTAQKVFVFPDPDISDVESIELEQQLSRSERRAAEDYQEIISKLEFLIRHHLEYFSDYNKFEGRKYQNLLLKTLIKIEKGAYCAEVDNLSKDLSKLTASLKKEETELKENKSLRKLYKNVHTLRSDLEIIEDLLVEDIAVQLDDHKSSLEDIKIYLLEKREYKKQQEEYQIKMYELQENLHEGISNFLEMQESLKITFNEDLLSDLLEAENLQKELEEVLDFIFTIELADKTIRIKIPTDSLGKEIIIPGISFTDNVPEIPDVPDLPDMHDPPEMPVYDHKPHYNYDYTTNSDKATLSNHYQNSMLIKSSRIPIFVQNQLGDLEVQGWDKNKIVAEYFYEVISDTYDDAEDFLESITLDLTADKSGIYISSNFPSIHNTKRQVINSNMILYLPKKNVVDITNSFGRTDVSDFNNDIIIKTKNSDMSVEKVRGSVSAIVKNGRCYFSRITGEVEVKSSRGEVIVENTNSSISVINSHAPVIITGCQGDVSLINSGEVVVSNHTGDVEISNKNGRTTIQSLTGDLTLSGSYQPFSIHSIDGSVDIENKNAAIELSEISGESIVLNKGGLIRARNLEGPIDLTNSIGEIYFIANSSLNGNSTIHSDYGKVSIILPETSNILLQASTEGGEIINSYNTKIKKDDFVSSTTVALGDKSKKLKVTGTNTTIIIKDSQ